MSEEYHKSAYDQSMKEAFAGDAQDLQAYDMAIYHWAQYRRLRLEALHIKRNRLWNNVYGPTAEAQDIDGMIEIAEIEEEMETLTNQA